MLTVLMECDNDEVLIAQTLSALVSGAVDGLVSDVILVDRGSKDGTARLADQAGCLLMPNGTPGDALKRARGRWVMLLEPGARPQSGWVESVSDYLAAGQDPVSFSPSTVIRRSWFKRLSNPAGRLELGIIVPREKAIAHVAAGHPLSALAPRRPRRLAAQIVPAWAARSAKAR